MMVMLISLMNIYTNVERLSRKAIKKVTKKKSGESEEESKQSSKKLSGKQEKITINPKTEND